MPRKRKNGTSSNNQPTTNGHSSGNKFEWVNIKFSDADMAALSASTDSLEFLAVCFAELADRGYGVSAKPTSDGQSICASIIGSVDDSGGRTVGVSCFSSTTRNALLGVLFKFEHYLGGTFSGIEHSVEADKPEFR